MKKIFISFVICILLVVMGWYLNQLYNSIGESDSQVINVIKPRPLDKYTIENLSKTKYEATPIERMEVINEYPKFTSYKIFINIDEKKVSGLINIPKAKGQFPIIVMFRGYVDVNQYQTGTGTQHSGEVFANNGYITIAPDFLGYADSDRESENVFEARFQTYTTALAILSSVKTIPEWDGENIFIWGHSNGGQIALTILEITGQAYPTVLWAPVSKPFPYSVLYYTDEADDKGKFLRAELANFEDTYDTDLYSIHTYLDKITAPILLQQGTLDDAVPVSWSDWLNDTLKKQEKDITYITYPGADHNMTPSWNNVVVRDLQFYRNHIKMN
ncbi:alpha/beta hydrolase family protein [Patescibacteria group bacterium]